MNEKKEIFPQEYLINDEKILFEARPALIMYYPKAIVFMGLVIFGLAITWSGIDTLKTVPDAFNPIPLVIGGILLIIALLIYRSAFAFGLIFSVLIFALIHGFDFSSMQEMDLNAMMLSLLIGFIIAGLLGFYLVYKEWLRTRYALTNRRILALYGTFSTILAACHHEKIIFRSLIQSFLEERFHFGTLIFATAAVAGGSRLLGRGLSDQISGIGAVIWRSIAKPKDSLRNVEALIEDIQNE